ncbi:MAG: LemA family protein [Ignavibacteriota bacterium]
MKYILSVFLAFSAASVFAQTPALFDTWSPMLAGSVIHISISEHRIIAHIPNEKMVTELPDFMALPSPKSQSDMPVEPGIFSPVSEKDDTLLVLKVVFDSAKAKGRIFTRPSKLDKSILPLAFLIRDNGEAEIGIAGDISDLISDRSKSLKQVERMTRPGAKRRAATEETIFDPMMNTFGKIRLTFYNQARSEEFAKLKDPLEMPKEEVIAMIGSFGNRISAALQNVPIDTSNSFFTIFNFIGPMLGNVVGITHSLFIAHGYNPLGAYSLLEKIKDDSDVCLAMKAMSEKVEESVPFLREEKIKREAAARESINQQIGELNSAFESRAESVSTLIVQINSSAGIDPKLLADVTAARSNAAGMPLSQAMMKDSLTFEKFNLCQKAFQTAIGNLLKAIESNDSLGANDEIEKSLSAIEAVENRIIVESARWNDLTSGKSGEAGYVHFMPREGEAVTFPDSH